MHRSIWRIALLSTLVVGLALPTTARAGHPATCVRVDHAGYGCGVELDTLRTYKGWAHTQQVLYCGGAHPGDMYANQSAPAWRWGRYGWSSTSLPGGTRVYVWPYAVGWSWVWTSTTGWVAMQDSLIVINPVTGCYRHADDPLPPTTTR